MPRNFRFSFTFGGERFDDVTLTWGLRWPRRGRLEVEDGDRDFDWDRSQIPDPRDREQGVGWTVDVPDVLAMLDQVRGGRASVDDMRDTLLALTQAASKKSGCCVECDAAIDDYADAVTRSERLRARFDDPVTYPYLVSQTAIHAWNCYHFTGQLPGGAGRSVSDYVHNIRPGGGVPELTRLTTAEAQRWMASRTGPKGGVRWRRCRSCQPELPGAWDSESNDVPTGRATAGG